jgi:hypothetical protein
VKSEVKDFQKQMKVAEMLHFVIAYISGGYKENFFNRFGTQARRVWENYIVSLVRPTTGEMNPAVYSAMTLYCALRRPKLDTDPDTRKPLGQQIVLLKSEVVHEGHR